MKKILKYERLEWSTRPIVFVKITEQSHRGIEFGIHGSNFTADNGMCLMSHMHPEFIHGDVYVRGYVHSKDDYIIEIPEEKIKFFEFAVNQYNNTDFDDKITLETIKKTQESVMKFRKKPEVVEAFQMTRERCFNNVEWPKWLYDAWNRKEGTPGSLYTVLGAGDAARTLLISTTEGQFPVSWGDWIMKDTQGELYLCKPDVFHVTYNPINEWYYKKKIKVNNMKRRKVIEKKVASTDVIEVCGISADDLREAISSEIVQVLKSKKPDIAYLAVLNSLLATTLTFI